MAPLAISSLAFCRRKDARHGGGAAHQGHAGLGAGVDHVVGLFQGEGHGLVHEDPLHSGFHRLDRQEGAAPGVGGDGQDVQVLLLVHLQGVGVERLDAVALAEHVQALLVPVGAGHQVHLGPVPDGLGVGGHQSLFARVVVVVELAVDLQPVGGGALGALQVVLGSLVGTPNVVIVPLSHVIEHTHPAQTHHAAPVLFAGFAWRPAGGAGRRHPSKPGSRCGGQGRLDEFTSDHKKPLC